jgi:RND family efflux transporter MFP subunit
MLRFVRLSLAAALLSATSFLGCGLARSEDEAPKARAAPAPVEVGPVREGVLTDTWTYVGEAQPLMEAQLAAGAPGEVLEVNVREGDRVSAGQLLVRVDPSLARARLKAAQAGVDQSVVEYELAAREQDRAANLKNVLSASEIEADAARATALASRASSQRASAKEAKAVLRRLQVVAPFDGVIAQRQVDPGDWVDPGDPVLRLLADNQLEILVKAAPALAPYVEEGHGVRVRGDGGEIAARVLGVVRALDPATRTITVRVAPESVAPWLLAGSVVDVDFAVERRGEGVVVDRDALVQGAVDTRVIKVVEGTAQSIPVRVLATADAQALVIGEGLVVGDQVVVRGNERLRPGQAVAVGP